MDKILFIDYYNFLHRACVKFDKKATAPDEEIFASNFFRNLRPMIEQFVPQKCFFALEGHPQFRYDLFSDYKANRIIKRASNQKRTELVAKTNDIVLNLLKLLPVTIVRAANYEADDLIATLVENLKNEDITILSNDSDYIQLLQKKYKKIQIYNPIKKEFQQSPPYPYVAWKCLAGDKSDNIPGLMSKAKAVEISSNPRKMLKFFENDEDRVNFNVNRELIEFKQVPEDEINLVDGTNDFETLKQKFEELKFDSILKSWEKYKKTFNCIRF